MGGKAGEEFPTKKGLRVWLERTERRATPEIGRKKGRFSGKTYTTYGGDTVRALVVVFSQADHKHKSWTVQLTE